MTMDFQKKPLVVAAAVLLMTMTSPVAVAAESADRELQVPEGIFRCHHEFGTIPHYNANNPEPFCANNGKCREDSAENPENPCDCPSGYGGPHCEFLATEVPTCVLPCQNDGTCMVGATKWNEMLNVDLMLNSDNMQYCMCPKGYHGLLCELTGDPCGDHYCENGGTCVELDDMTVEGGISHHCDCTNAGNDMTAFAGEFCEVPSTTICAQGIDPNGRHFCVNGGSCRGESHLGCTCMEGYVGPVCEFVEMQFEPQECSLQCYNHGICRKGAKDMSALQNFGIHNRHLIHQAYSENFEHCVCPAGYAGLQCEFRVDICPGGQHICMNGGECDASMEGDVLGFTCDCRSAKTRESRFAGAFCEMESTQFCTIDSKKTPRGKGQDAFCTNGGRCLAFVQHGQEHPGCECQRGFYGDQCELVGASTTRSTDTSGSSRKGLVTSMTVLLALLILGLAFVLYQRKRREDHLLFGRSGQSGPTTDHFAAMNPWGSFKDFDSTGHDDDDEEFDEVDLDYPHGGNGDSQCALDSHSVSSFGQSTASSLTMEDHRVVHRKPQVSLSPASSSNSTVEEMHLFTDNQE